MDEQEAAWIAQSWSGGRGLVPRGPRWLLGYAPADPSEVERHTGRRPPAGADVWRVDVGGRFLRSGGLVYPGGVPFPEELAHRTATVSSEVWLYVEADTTRVLGMHSWPEAVRKPVASQSVADFPADDVRHPDDASRWLDITLRIPSHPSWVPTALVCASRTSAVLFLTVGTTPDPLTEMLLFEQGGLSLRATADEPLDIERVMRDHAPPFRRTRVGRSEAVGRETGRSLGPQTWPWPGELWWFQAGVRYELKGFVPLVKLEEVARSV